MRYQRLRVNGGTYFFTLVTHRRRRLLCTPENVYHLREAFRSVTERHPFKLDAFVLLPDHLHAIWKLPEGDDDFSMRWRLIKSAFTRRCGEACRGPASASCRRKGEQAVWQRRFWEHRIRDERDRIQHIEYIHYNPVKHGLVEAPRDWAYSSFQRYVREGMYDSEWGAGDTISFEDGVGSE